MTAAPSSDLDVDLIALYLSGWWREALDPLFHEEVEDQIFQARETFARRTMSTDDALRASFADLARDRGIDGNRLEVARGALSRFRFGLLPSDPDHPDAFVGFDSFGLPLTNRDLTEIYYTELPDGS
ncbi:hypothetical protein EF903_05365 [Streptomyces sp. WAC05292]|uniref:hypothetical protein n=1 Tax=Streptomyces sp. WAC05292 TaxID=2487418 RepID=UPI000F740EBD|nr:hypothetical protein [Streptomyces sp. WAC05292]RSS95070.1 hypothetical protein EF903_05365 [Streptomyces sp. WAC05292]